MNSNGHNSTHEQVEKKNGFEETDTQSVFETPNPNPFLIEFIEGVRNEIEQTYLHHINRFYVKDIDVQQTLELNNTEVLQELDRLQRKLFLMSKGGLRLSASLYNRMGFYFLIREFYSDGVELLTKVLDQIDEKDVAYNLLGILYYRLGYLDLASDSFNRLMKMKTNLKGWRYSLGIISYLQDRYSEAIDYLLPEKEQYSSRPNYLLCVGNCYYFQNNYQQALPYLLSYLEKQDRNNKVMERIFTIYYDEQQFDKAKTFLIRLEKAEGQLPNHIFKWAVINYYQNNLNQTIDNLTSLVNYDKDLIPDLHSKSEAKEDFIFGLFLQSFEMQIYDHYIFQIINDLINRDQSGQRLIILKKKSKTLNEIKTDKPDQILFQAHFNMLLEQYDFAEFYLKQLISKGIQTNEIIIHLCKSLFLQKKKDEGLELFKQLDQLDQLELMDGEVLFLAAEVYYEKEDFKQTIRLLDLSLDRGYQHSDVYNLLGFCNFSNGDFEKSIDAYQHLIQINPDDLDARNDLGIAYTQVKNYNESIVQFKYILEKDPNNKEAHFNLNKVYRLILEKEADNHYNHYVELTKS